MKVTSQRIQLSAIDLSNYLACRHLMTLDLQVARGKRTEPEWAAPDLAKSLDGYNCQDIKPLYFGIPNSYGTFEVKRLYLS